MTRANNNWNKFDAWLYTLYIATLPLFSIRSFLFGFSLTLLFLIIITLRSSTRILKGNVSLNLSRLDLLLLIYILLAAFSIVYSSNETYSSAIGKSIAYFLAYLGLKIHFGSCNFKFMWLQTVKGALIGVLLFIFVTVYSLIVTSQINTIFSDLSYWRFTFRIFQSIYVAFNTAGSGAEEFLGSNVMRNTVGEIFAVYAIIFMLALKHSAKFAIPGLITTSVFVILSYSRRALIVVVVAYLLSQLTGKKNFRGREIAKILIAAIALFLFLQFSPNIDNRFSSLGEDSRIAQYYDVVDRLEHIVLTGAGYGAKIKSPKAWKGDIYIHNFLLGSFYMLGILGLVLSIFVYLHFAFQFFSVFKTQTLPIELFLLVPLIGLLVSFTTEGMFTPATWFILAMVGTYTVKSKNY